ncbi:hypothetical protein LINPERHAP1_LOCUS19134 [Linum perenne]
MVRDGPPITHLFYADDLFLCGTASIDQIEAIKKSLSQFCSASGLSVNNEKSSIFYSKNTDKRLCLGIVAMLEMPLTRDLGRYLGVPILHGRTTTISINVPYLLWVQLLHSKYFNEVNGELIPRNTISQSTVWRGISCSWSIILRGALSGIRDGTSITFWMSRWLDSGVILIDHVRNAYDDLDLLAMTNDLVLEDGN